MTKTELENKLAELLMIYESSKRMAMKEFAMSNNPYKVGDRFTDHIGTIVIESIGTYLSEKPCCTYFGTTLKRDGKPRKDGVKRQAYQSNEVFN